MATLENKVVLIIGGTAGIGYGVAEASLKSLAQVVIVASSSKLRVENAVKKLIDAKHGPGQVRGHVVDAGNEEELKALLGHVGEVDHIVFTSGRLGENFSFPSLDIKSGGGLLEVRLWGVVAVAKHAKFRPGGSLTLTSGTYGLKPSPTFSVVSAAVASLFGLTKGLAVDLAPIRVNVVTPGVVKTEIWDQFPKENRESMLNDLGPKLPVKHVGMPDEVAEAYLFCMKCTYITGQNIVVDGGQLLT